MTIKELIESLESAMEDVGEDCEVRLAFQPNYPLEYSVGPVEVAWGEDEEADNDGTVVYIGEGGQLGYLSSLASQWLGWR